MKLNPKFNNSCSTLLISTKVKRRFNKYLLLLLPRKAKKKFNKFYTFIDPSVDLHIFTLQMHYHWLQIDKVRKLVSHAD